VITNITRLKRAEETLTRREAELHVALDSMAGALAYTDDELARRLGGTVIAPALLAVERSFPLPYAHGATRIAGAATLAEGVRLSFADGAAPCAEQLLFLDTETSGLAGGTARQRSCRLRRSATTCSPCASS
jgi:hypothetical protein